VGAVTALGLAYKSGMKVIGISDASGAFYNAGGIDVGAADKHAAQRGSLEGFGGAEKISPDELLTLKCDVLIPAAVEGVITARNAGRLQCRVLAEAANGPTTPEADEVLFKRWDEIFVIPDILCNAGGVIVSYFEWVQDLQSFFWNETEITDKLFRILEQAFAAVIKRAREAKIPHRMSAMSIGVERVLAAKKSRGLFP
jgi:glutamate dehydrogenase (NAD(P)+)